MIKNKIFDFRKGKSEIDAGIGIKTKAIMTMVNNHQIPSRINFNRNDGSIKIVGDNVIKDEDEIDSSI